jgi:hypothetical protein
MRGLACCRPPERVIIIGDWSRLCPCPSTSIPVRPCPRSGRDAKPDPGCAPLPALSALSALPIPPSQTYSDRNSIFQVSAAPSRPALDNNKTLKQKNCYSMPACLWEPPTTSGTAVLRETRSSGSLCHSLAAASSERMPGYRPRQSETEGTCIHGSNPVPRDTHPPASWAPNDY